MGNEGFRSETRTKRGEWGYIELRSVTQHGQAVPWTFVHPDGGPLTDRTVARFDLPRAVPPGGTAVLELEFHDQLPRVVARTGWFGSYHLVAQWFPKVGVLELPGERGATEPRWNCHELHLYSENTLRYIAAERGFVTADLPLPPLKTPLRGRPALIVARGEGCKQDLAAIHEHETIIN